MKPQITDSCNRECLVPTLQSALPETFVREEPQQRRRAHYLQNTRGENSPASPKETLR